MKIKEMEDKLASFESDWDSWIWNVIPFMASLSYVGLAKLFIYRAFHPEIEERFVIFKVWFRSRLFLLHIFLKHLYQK